MQVVELSRTKEPSIAVAAISPHNGEGDLLGTVGVDEIVPAVDAAYAPGNSRPRPFLGRHPVSRVICSAGAGGDLQHHDQANIARKLHGLRDSAGPFFGPPVPYATTAHGTAFDLVGNEAAGLTSSWLLWRFVVRQWVAHNGEVTTMTSGRTEFL
jgi:4-hydroxythreonine-4-phosphate dehydrogenase